MGCKCVYILGQIVIDLPEKMTASALIHRAASALYGDRPQTAMARDLGVTTRTVYRWLHGQPTPAPKFFVALREHLRTRLDVLDGLDAAIEHYLEGLE
jgi:hypothetical protein